MWPTKRTHRFMSLLDPRVPSDARGKLPPADWGKNRCRRHVKKAYLKWRAKGVDPKTHPVFVDIDCSMKFQASNAKFLSTLTASRGAQGGPWVSTRSRRTTLSEMSRAQGFDPSILKWAMVGVSAAEAGHMLGNVGNAMTLPVVQAVLKNALYASGLVSQA